MVQRKTNDRTQITEIQKAFEADLYHRLIRDSEAKHNAQPLRQALRVRVVDDDALELTTLQFTHVGSDTEAALQFDFPENPDAAADFEDWLDGKINNDVLERASRSRVVDGRHYSSEYIRQSSEQGVKHADRELKRAGAGDLVDDDTPVSAILRTPVHEDIMRSAFIRSYDELDNITGEMATEISRVMSDSLADGVNPRETARRMNDRVDVGLTRSRRIARTETARTYNLHSAARYDDLGVTEVRILTANPCDRCVGLREGGPYSVSEAGSLLPEHPNCVCSIAPITETINA